MNNVLNALLKISAKQELHFAVKIDFTLILERIFQKKKKKGKKQSTKPPALHREGH